MNENLPATRQPGALKVLSDFFSKDAVYAALAKTAPETLDPKRLVRVALSTMQRNPKLLECNRESLYTALMDCAEVGLMPDRFGECYLVPYAGKAQMQLGYRGMARLMKQANPDLDIEARAVHKNDKFEIRYGSEQGLTHVPCLTDDPGPIIGAYWFARTGEGRNQFHFLSIAQIHAIRDRSQAYRYAEKSGKKDSPWHTDYESMCQKTALKQAPKFLPMSSEPLHGKAHRSLQDVIADDSALELGESASVGSGAIVDDPDPTPAKPNGAGAAGKLAQEVKRRRGRPPKQESEPQPQPPDDEPPQQASGDADLWDDAPKVVEEEEPTVQAEPETAPPATTATSSGDAPPRTDDAKRTYIKAVVMSLAKNDKAAADALLGDWTGGQDLTQLDPDDLDVTYQIAFEERAKAKGQGQ